jgi:hypothetical protein
MFESKTVFVIGAGASKEADLPIGNELTAEIAKLIDFQVDYGSALKRGDNQIYESIRRLVQQQPDDWRNNKLIASGRQVATAMTLAPSIDTFLQTHRNNAEYVLLGKMGIAKAIIRAEQRSKLARTENRSKPFRMSSVAGTWYISLAQQLFSGIPAEQPELAFQNVSFIVFNYDRCLEVFLEQAIELFFLTSPEKARDIVASINIVHPYGDLGKMDDRVQNMPMFGDEQCDLYLVSQRIQTFSESILDPEKSKAIKALVRQTETLIFLGFAFYDQNMELLGENVTKAEKTSDIRRVYATTFGMSASDVQVARTQIGYLLKGRPPKERDDYSVQTFSGTCHSLFAEYWKSLTAPVAVQRTL